MAASSDRKGNAPGRLAILFLCAYVIVCLGVVYWVGDLAKIQQVISARESRDALYGVNTPEQLDQVLKQYPSNRFMRMIALASQDAIEIDAATRRLLKEAEPRDLSTPIDFSTTNLRDLDALLRDLKIAETNAAALKPRYIALVKAERDKVEKDARSLKLENAATSKFMSMIDEQHRAMTVLTSKILAARADYYGAYERCAAILVREFGIYKVTNNQLVFPFASTANSYNSAAAALATAAKHIAELDDERNALRRSQIGKWKDFIEAR